MRGKNLSLEHLIISLKEWITFAIPGCQPSRITDFATIKHYQGRNVPGLAHGKMYKRYTFGSSCPSLGTRFGFVKDV